MRFYYAFRRWLGHFQGIDRQIAYWRHRITMMFRR
jgi:hypothetical protein